MHSSRSAGGFTVVEAVVALGIVTTGVLSMAGLAVQVTETVSRARRHTVAALLAEQGIALRIGRPPAATPTDCLERDVAGCVEALDAAGRIASGPPAFVRRWRAARVGGVTPPAWALTVCVVPSQARSGPGIGPGACVSRIVWDQAP